MLLGMAGALNPAAAGLTARAAAVSAGDFEGPTSTTFLRRTSIAPNQEVSGLVTVPTLHCTGSPADVTVTVGNDVHKFRMNPCTNPYYP